ncbi:methionyl-tRNA formyltransferase [candidate division KSB1 bacterium]|nr:methionyl-tRNA formyltransferase [candidate division KSB1 bacterium]
MSLRDLKIVFMGTPEFALPSLQSLCETGAQVVAVVTGMDKPAGRGMQIIATPIKQFALQRGIPVLQPEKLNDPAFVAALQQLRADLFIVVAFRILPVEVFTLPPRGTINLHAALLPRHRGAAPIQWAIMNGETETGVTTFFIDEKMDNGEMLLQERVAIGENETAGELHDRMAVIGAELLLQTVTQLAEGRLQSRPQQGEITRAPKITKEMAELDWSKPASVLRNWVRGLNPVPGAHTHWQGKLLKIFASEVREHASSEFLPGQVCLIDAPHGELWIQTGEHALALRELQLEGKKKMSAAEFLRGYHVVLNEQFESSSVI